MHLHPKDAFKKTFICVYVYMFMYVCIYVYMFMPAFLNLLFIFTKHEKRLAIVNVFIVSKEKVP